MCFKQICILYDLNTEERIPIIKNWLGREGLQFIQTVAYSGKQTCKSATGLLIVLKEKFKHNEMTLSLQYSKLYRKKNESIQEWMGTLHRKAAECNNKEYDR